MKAYRQPKVGTPDVFNVKETKIVNKKSNPIYLQRQNIFEYMKAYYKGDTNNEWQ